jgi:hypothetical protein
MSRPKFLFILFLAVLFLFSGCIKRVERQTKMDYSRYFPLHEGDQFSYAGISEKAVVTGGVGELFTMTYFDTSDNILRREDFLKRETGVRFKGLFVFDRVTKFYEPSLPFGPWSNLIGDTLLVGSVEIRCDSAGTHLPLVAEYRIVAIETMVTPAGSFDDCIEIHRVLKPAENSESGISREESSWWFAPDVGLVRSETPDGIRELIGAVVDGVTYPKQ